MTLIACRPVRRSCWCCDASRAFTPDREWIVTAQGHVYCSLECHDEWEERLREQAALRACCVECGFDRCEHDAGCSLAPSGAPAVPGQAG